MKTSELGRGCVASECQSNALDRLPPRFDASITRLLSGYNIINQLHPCYCYPN